jgi:hypothetical protein
MADLSIRFDVFLSSTWIDFKSIRPVITEAIQKAGHVARGMEQFPAMSDEVFEYIKKVIDECSYYVLISGARYGSISPKHGKSYTHLEFEYAKSRDIPTLCFLLNDEELRKIHDKIPDELANFRSLVKTEARVIQDFSEQTYLPQYIVAALANRHGREPRNFWINSSDADYQNLKHWKAEGLVRFDAQSNMADESQRIGSSKSLVAILNDGYGWVPKYKHALEQRFSDESKSTTIIFLDPDAAVLPLIAEKSGKKKAEQVNDIWSRVGMLVDGAGDEAYRKGRLRVFGSHRPLASCYFIFDDCLIWNPYLTKFRPPQLPRIELKRTGTVAQYLLTDAEVLERELAARNGADLVAKLRSRATK